MPGIEHYRRKDADGSLPLPPAKIASLLFSTLIEGGESMILNEQRERFEKVTDFDVNAFDRFRFIYLAANVAVLLTQFATKYPTVAEIIPPLRELVLHAMRERWRDSEDSADEAIEKASAAYAALAYTNPATDRGISFDWPQTWLTEVGIAEYNPITLFRIAHTFRNYHLHALQFISSVVAGEQEANAQAAPKLRRRQHAFTGMRPRLYFGLCTRRSLRSTIPTTTSNRLASGGRPRRVPPRLAWSALRKDTATHKFTSIGAARLDTQPS